MLLPYLPFGTTLGFTHLPFEYYPILVTMVVVYLGFVEGMKGVFYARRVVGEATIARRRPRRIRRIHRRASRFSHDAAVDGQASRRRAA